MQVCFRLCRKWGHSFYMQANQGSVQWKEFGFQSRKQTSRELLVELKKCTSTKNLRRGREKHTEAVENGFDSCIYVATALANMYAKCGSMVEAHQVFDGIKHPDVVLWTALILGYADNGEGDTALCLFARMKCQGCAPDSFTCVAALKACASLAQKQDGNGREACLEQGRQIHSEIGCHLNLFVQNALIDMYVKAGSMDDARQVFDRIKQPDVVSWTALILGYAEQGEGVTALDLFSKMQFQGCAPTSVTYVAVVKACTSFTLKRGESKRAECLERGRQIHSKIGCHMNSYVQNTLIDMYAKCGSMADARQVFKSMKYPNEVSWSALIMGYAENGESATALELFEKMKYKGCTPTSVTFVAALKACTSLALKQGGSVRAEFQEQGKQIHLEIGSHSDIYVQNTLIDTYAKCGNMVEAQQTFESIKYPNTVSWNALMLGYTENGDGTTALTLFARMKFQGCAPDHVTFVAALKACGLIGALESGRKIRAEIYAGTELNVFLVTCLVDFYGRCGSLIEAQEVFDSEPRRRDLITWNALMAGYSRLGDENAVFRLFEGMQDAGFQPNDVTFLCILTCCSHAGLIVKANKFFEAMSTNYGIAPIIEHYNCMIDILGRSNKLDDAIAFLRKMPFRPGVVTWMTVLGACCQWKNVEIGRLAFNAVMTLDATNGAAYVLMTHIYESKGMINEKEMILGMRKRFKVNKVLLDE